MAVTVWPGGFRRLPADQGATSPNTPATTRSTRLCQLGPTVAETTEPEPAENFSSAPYRRWEGVTLGAARHDSGVRLPGVQVNALLGVEPDGLLRSGRVGVQGSGEQ